MKALIELFNEALIKGNATGIKRLCTKAKYEIDKYMLSIGIAISGEYEGKPRLAIIQLTGISEKHQNMSFDEKWEISRYDGEIQKIYSNSYSSGNLNFTDWNNGKANFTYRGNANVPIQYVIIDNKNALTVLKNIYDNQKIDLGLIVKNKSNKTSTYKFNFTDEAYNTFKKIFELNK